MSYLKINLLPKIARPISAAPSNIILNGSETKLAFLSDAASKTPKTKMVDANFFIFPPLGNNLSVGLAVKMRVGSASILLWWNLDVFRTGKKSHRY